MPEEKTGEIAIKREKFDRQISNLKAHIDQCNPDRITIKKVPEKGTFLGILDHKVTGTEFNEGLSQVADYLIELGNVDYKILKATTDIYEALKALDKEYISGILIAAESAKSASDKANNNVDSIDKIVKVLQKHKKELEKLKHLMDIDKAWTILEDHKRMIDGLCG